MKKTKTKGRMRMHIEFRYEYKTIREACVLYIEDKNIYFDERSGNQFDIR